MAKDIDKIIDQLEKGDKALGQVKGQIIEALGQDKISKVVQLLKKNTEAISDIEKTIIEKTAPQNKAFYKAIEDIESRTSSFETMSEKELSKQGKDLLNKAQSILKEAKDSDLKTLDLQKKRKENLLEALEKSSGQFDENELNFVKRELTAGKDVIQAEIKKRKTILGRTKSLLSKNSVDIGGLLLGATANNPIVALGVLGANRLLRMRSERKKQEQETLKQDLLDLKDGLKDRREALRRSYKESRKKVDTEMDDGFETASPSSTYRSAPKVDFSEASRDVGMNERSLAEPSEKLDGANDYIRDSLSRILYAQEESWYNLEDIKKFTGKSLQIQEWQLEETEKANFRQLESQMEAARAQKQTARNMNLMAGRSRMVSGGAGGQSGGEEGSGGIDLLDVYFGSKLLGGARRGAGKVFSKVTQVAGAGAKMLGLSKLVTGISKTGGMLSTGVKAGGGLAVGAKVGSKALARLAGPVGVAIAAYDIAKGAIGASQELISGELAAQQDSSRLGAMGGKFFSALSLGVYSDAEMAKAIDSSAKAVSSDLVGAAKSTLRALPGGSLAASLYDMVRTKSPEEQKRKMVDTGVEDLTDLQLELNKEKEALRKAQEYEDQYGPGKGFNRNLITAVATDAITASREQQEDKIRKLEEEVLRKTKELQDKAGKEYNIKRVLDKKLRENTKSSADIYDQQADYNKKYAELTNKARAQGLDPAKVLKNVKKPGEKGFRTSAELKSAKDLISGDSDVIDKLYASIAVPETGAGKPLDDPSRFIRTKAGSNSSAYGPVQITRNLMRSYLGGAGKNDLSPEEMEYAKRFVEQGNQFLGSDYSDKQFGAGGQGMLNTPEDRMMYEQVSKKLMASEYNRVGGDLDKFTRAWRGVDETQDPNYFKKVRSVFNELNEDGRMLAGPAKGESSAEKIKNQQVQMASLESQRGSGVAVVNNSPITNNNVQAGGSSGGGGSPSVDPTRDSSTHALISRVNTLSTG